MGSIPVRATMELSEFSDSFFCVCKNGRPEIMVLFQWRKLPHQWAEEGEQQDERHEQGRTEKKTYDFPGGVQADALQGTEAERAVSGTDTELQ